MSTPSADERWYRTAFGPITAAFWTGLVPKERVEKEAAFLAATLEAPPGGLLLDVPCGAGRQARALGRLGFRVEGVDISEHMLAASGEPPVDGVSFRQGEMTAITATNRYDGAICWGNSFGYLSDADSRAFIAGVARALRPGARFVLESGAIAENILAAFQPTTEMTVAGFRFSAERRYDVAASAMHIRYRIERGVEAEEFTARQAVYTAAEVLRMAEQAGLTTESLHGGIGGEPAGLGRPLIAVFRRR